jgi:tetratricopeptide (TPR) repeat protein
MRKGDFNGAIADYTEVIRQITGAVSGLSGANPSDPIVKNSHITKFSIQDLRDASAAFEALAYVNRGLARRSKLLRSDQRATGDWDDIIADFTRAHELEAAAMRSPMKDDLGIPKINFAAQLAEAYFDRGGAKVSKSDWDGAIADYSAAIQLKPDYPEAYYNRGSARGSKGDETGATADHARAFQLKPDLPYPR